MHYTGIWKLVGQLIAEFYARIINYTIYKSYREWTKNQKDNKYMEFGGRLFAFECW